MGLVFYLLALTINSMTGWNMDEVILISGLLTVSYTLKGGFEAVVWTDVVQGLIIWTGIFVSLGFLIFLPPGGAAKAVLDLALAASPVFAGQHVVRFLQAHRVGARYLRLLLVPAALHHRPDAGAALPVGQVRPRCGARRGHGRVAGGPRVEFCYADRHLHLDFSGSPAKSCPPISPRATRPIPHFLSTHLPPGIAGLVMAGPDGLGDVRALE